MQDRRVQIDFILQKQNLTHHHENHPTMYMPSHTEFMVEIMCRMGFLPGTTLALDEFILDGERLNASSSEVLIVCGADQHLTADFIDSFKKVTRTYQRKVLVVSEPIFSTMAYYQNENTNAKQLHKTFVHAFEPDIILYLSAFDVEQGQENFPGTQCLLYSLADGGLMHSPIIPWEQKKQALLWLGKPTAWEFTQRSQRFPEALRREQQLDYFVEQTHIGFQGYTRHFTFRECYEVANQYQFQLQPLSGFAFHSARAVQAAILNSIPILLLHPQDAAILEVEAPFARHGHNCLIAYEGHYERLLKQLQDQEQLLHVSKHVNELLAGGTIQSCLAHLGNRLFKHFFPR